MKKTAQFNRSITISALLTSAILIAVYIVGQFFYTKFDATEENRYTLTPATKRTLEQVEDQIYIKVMLDGKFPASFKRLQTATLDMLREFSRINPNIQYNLDDPNVGTTEEVNARRKQLADQKIIPTQLRLTGTAGESAQYIYPYALVYSGETAIPVSLLQDDVPGADKDVIINNSVNLLEYNLIDGIKKVLRRDPISIVFTSGQGELSNLQIKSILGELSKGYVVNRINLDSVIEIPSRIDVLVIAKPTEKFTDAQIFMIDQYVMNGGNLICMIDPLNVSLDSINANKQYIPQPYDIGLDPLLFKYGVRINQDLVLDLQCTRIPMVIGMQGDKPQTELFPWYYSPLAEGNPDFAISKGLDKIQFEFPARIDTLETSADIRKSLVLRSSPYSRIQLNPVRLSFAILREELDPTLFDKGPQNLGVLLEGKFTSVFQNRLTEDMKNTLEQLNITFKAESDQAKILVISDGDFVKNLVNPATDEVAPLGFNKYEGVTFTGNRDFFLNVIEHMTDPSGILEARTKDIKLRLIDKVKVNTERTYWQLLNILGPVIGVVLLGIVYTVIRRRKFGYTS